MSEHELEKLLGGFAADTLTAEEKQRLYTAALHDQRLFEALADEQALKEVLSDPAVRRRLLQELNQTSPAGVGDSRSWLDWFHRPAGLAWAGGLAAAAVAVVLGMQIYQEILKQDAPSVATEETKPVAPRMPPPPVSQPAPSPPAGQPEPQLKSEKNLAPEKTMAKKDALFNQVARQERTALSPPQEQKAPDSATSVDLNRQQQGEARRLAAPPASTPAQSPPRPAATGAIAPTANARALFYGEAVTRLDSGTVSQEGERVIPQIGRAERKKGPLSAAGKAAGTTTSLKPLGVRYSFVVREPDGRDREVDQATAMRGDGQIRLTVEANQEAHLQVWKRSGSSPAHMLLPDEETGQTSIKVVPGQRLIIPLPKESGPVTLAARLSRAPLGPVAEQGPVVSDRLAAGQVIESIPASGPDPSQEQATYAVNQDPSAAQLSVSIFLTAP